MSYQIYSSEHHGQVISKDATKPTASHPYSMHFTSPDQDDAAHFETLYNAVSVKRHLEAVGVQGLFIRETD